MNDLQISVDPHTVESIRRIAAKKGMTVEQMASYLLEKTLFGVPRRISVQVTDYKPAHTIVMLSSEDQRIKKTYRCNTCGNPVFDYYGGVVMTTEGQFDMDGNLFDGSDVDWFNKLGVPTVMECAGRVNVQHPDGGQGRIRCRAVYYKVGA